MSSVIEALRSRRSQGKVLGDVSEPQIRTLIEAVTWAPNHRRTKPWSFTVVRGNARERLGKAWADIVARASTLDPAQLVTLRQREAQKPLRAPVLLVIACRTSDDPILAVEDFAATAAGTQNLLLAAQEMGLGAIWRTGEMAYHPAIREFLNLQLSDRIVGIIYIGQPVPQPHISPIDRGVAEIQWLS